MYTSRTRFGAQDNGGGMFEQVKTCANEAVERADALVRENPASSTLITFAVGCGLGMLATLAFAPRASRRRSCPWASQAFSRERLARMIEDLLPEVVSRYVSGKS